MGQIIGKVNPKLYAENGTDLLKKYGTPDEINADEVKEKPISEHKLTYDSSSETFFFKKNHLQQKEWIHYNN